MKKMFKRIVCILLFLFLNFSFCFASSVWKVSSKENYIYLGGTFHMLRASDFPLPVEFGLAYQDSDTLGFETDLDEIQSPDVLQQMMSKAVLKNKTLKDVLSASVYKKLSDYCAAVGLPIDSIHRFKPSMAMLVIVMLEFEKLGITQEGVDIYFHKLGIKDGKTTRHLETVEEQIEFIVSIGEGSENDFVSNSIQDMKKIQKTISNGIIAWKEGDRSALKKIFIDSMKQDYPRLYKNLLVNRNNKWMPQIETFLNSNERIFILVGLAHLIGEDGILTQLENLGYLVEEL